jgi:hypothetical protein
MQPATTFAVCSFKRVFDTTPAQEVLTLAELTACFRRFELKPQLHTRIQREVTRIDRALDQVLGGQVLGERATAIQAAAIEADKRGDDRERAIRARAEELRADARREAKRDLRLWSPVRYRDDCTERGSDGVSHVTCLVLDHDRPIRIQDAIAPFDGHFLLWHSTWSYREGTPKFRIILPLAAAVPASEWDKVWSWAYRESGGEIDRSMSGTGTTYAMPATPSIDWPREAGSLAGPLLDPRQLGVKLDEPLRLPVHHLAPSVMMGDPEKTYIEHGASEAVHVYDDPEDEHWESDGRATFLPEDRALAAPPSMLEPASSRRRKTIVVDFDGVLHSYRSGWRGATVIPDPPVPGALAWLQDAVERFEIAILSARSKEEGGIEAMQQWLEDCGLPAEVLGKLLFPRTKPAAHVYLDDRGWRFEGTFPELDDLDAFEPWHRR